MQASFGKDAAEGYMKEAVRDLLKDLLTHTTQKLLIPQTNNGQRWYEPKRGIRQGDGGGPRIWNREFYDVISDWEQRLATDPEHIPLQVTYEGTHFHIASSSYADDSWRLYIHWQPDQLEM